MSASKIRCYRGTVPGSGREVEFTADPSHYVVGVQVDGRTVPFVLTDTPVAGGAFFAEPAQGTYL